MRGKVLVTGGAGFLGSNLCARLVAEGWEVWCIDSLRTGSLANISALADAPSFHFLERDITDGVWVQSSLDYVLNLASPASPKDYAKYPIDTLRTGALGTDCVLRLAKRKGAVFLLASTSEVYGDPEHHPQSEWYWGHVNPIGPRSCYDEAKRYAEALTVAFAQAHDVQVRIARIFNTYGPRMRPEDGRVVSTFCCQALRGEPLTVYGDGSQTRSLCYVDDLVEGLLSLAFSQERGPVNLGNPEEVTVLRLAEEVREAAGGRSEIVFRPLPENDPKRRRPDITLARKVLGWEPRVSRSEGLRRTLGYFDDLLSGHLPGSPEATSKSGGS